MYVLLLHNNLLSVNDRTNLALLVHSESQTTVVTPGMFSSQYMDVENFVG